MIAFDSRLVVYLALVLELEMAKTARIPRFYQLSLDERIEILREWANLADDEVTLLREGHALDLAQADYMIENVVGVYGLPLGIATNFQINGRDFLVPMVVEEPSVVAAASHAARLVRDGGGFQAESDSPVMIGQVQVLDVPDPAAAGAAIRGARAEIVAEANRRLPSLVELGGGVQDVEVRTLADPATGPMIVVHLLIDVRDAMGANAVNTAAEAVAPTITRLTGGRVNLRILSNLADRRLTRVRCRVPASSLARDGVPGAAVVRGIVEAQVLAEIDPYRAATHNKGIMNGIDAVVVATGNDWRAAEAGAHAYAARSGQYRALTEWRRDSAGDLSGYLELPLALGIVGGTTRVHPLARLALKILAVESAQELAQIAAAVGLAQNLGALRALATEGIQPGHMELHARQIAIAAGATGEQIERVAQQLVAEGNIRLARAQEILGETSIRR